MNVNPPCPTCKQPDRLLPTTLCAEGALLWQEFVRAVGGAVVTFNDPNTFPPAVRARDAWNQHLHGVSRADVVAALEEMTSDWDVTLVDECPRCGEELDGVGICPECNYGLLTKGE